MQIHVHYYSGMSSKYVTSVVFTDVRMAIYTSVEVVQTTLAVVTNTYRLTMLICGIRKRYSKQPFILEHTVII